MVHARTLSVLTLLFLTFIGCPTTTPDVDGGDLFSDAGADGGPDGEAGDGGTGDGGTGVIPAADYCATIVDFFCPFYVRCGRMAVDTVDECRAQFLEGCEGRYGPRYAGLEEAGLLTLSKSGVEACEAHLDAVACEDQLRDLDGPCGTMWQGTVADQGACGFDVESFVCAPGTECVLTLSLCGTCETVVPVGDSCVDARCTSDAECIDDVCVARIKVNETCDPDGVRCETGTSCVDNVCTYPITIVDVGDACDQTNRCPYGTICLGGVCEATAAVGETCSPGVIECDTGWCDEGTCAPLGLPGDACTDDGQCATGRCDGAQCEGMPGVCFE